MINHLEILKSNKRNTITINIEKTSKIQLGHSKIGGMPHMPIELSWPYYLHNEKHIPLSFLMQINCSEIKQYDINKELPSDGILYFFYDLKSETYGYDPQDKDTSKVLFYSGNYDNLIIRSYPKDLEDDYKIPERKVLFNNNYNIPSYEEYNYDLKDKIDWNYYDNAIDLIDIKPARENEIKLLGYADVIQNDMLAECQLASNGIYCGEPKGFKTSNAINLLKDRKEWILLLQFGSYIERQYELLFGDMGNLYFFIKKTDLHNRNFNDVWHILQSC